MIQNKDEYKKKKYCLSYFHETDNCLFRYFINLVIVSCDKCNAANNPCDCNCNCSGILTKPKENINTSRCLKS